MRGSRRIYVEHNGITDTIAGWARRRGVSVELAYRRRGRGWTPRQSVELDPPPSRKWGKTFEHDGVTDTLLGWSKRTGIPEVTIRHRLDVGWSFPQAIEQGDPPSALWTSLVHNGIEDTVAGWAKRLNVSETFIRKRLRAGFAVDDALDTDTKQEPLPPIKCGGLTMTVGDWSRERGIPQPKLAKRIQLGWTPEQALGYAPAPVQVGGKRYAAEVDHEGTVVVSRWDEEEWTPIAGGRWVVGRIVDCDPDAIERPVIPVLEAEVVGWLQGRPGEKWGPDRAFAGHNGRTMVSTRPIHVGDARYHVTVDKRSVVVVSKWTGFAWAVAAEGSWNDGRLEGCDILGADVLDLIEVAVAELM